MTRLLPLILPTAFLACALDSSEDLPNCVAAELEAELGADAANCDVDSADGKADRVSAIETDGLKFLRTRSERELAALFAAGTADRIPLGRNDGLPLLLGFDWLAPKISRIYVGSIWEETGAVRPDGDPIVRLRDAWLRTPEGHLVTKFEADVRRGNLLAIDVAPGVEGPRGSSRPHPFVPIYRERLEVDGGPSLFVSYRDDPTPVINRILDEIREVDADRCPGLLLGRAHYLRPSDEWVYLYWFALDFGRDDGDCEPVP